MPSDRCQVSQALIPIYQLCRCDKCRKALESLGGHAMLPAEPLRNYLNERHPHERVSTRMPKLYENERTIRTERKRVSLRVVDQMLAYYGAEHMLAVLYPDA